MDRESERKRERERERERERKGERESYLRRVIITRRVEGELVPCAVHTQALSDTIRSTCHST